MEKLLIRDDVVYEEKVDLVLKVKDDSLAEEGIFQGDVIRVIEDDSLVDNKVHLLKLEKK